MIQEEVETDGCAHGTAVFDTDRGEILRIVIKNGQIVIPGEKKPCGATWPWKTDW